MKEQEHRLTTELYRMFAPFAVTTECIGLRLDSPFDLPRSTPAPGDAPALPDMWFVLPGGNKPVQLCVRLIEHCGGVALRRPEVVAWRTEGGDRKDTPDFWVATDDNFQGFCFWAHARFVPALDASCSRGARVMLSAPRERLYCSSVQGLALQVLRQAE